jgi:hypothetical protein
MQTILILNKWDASDWCDCGLILVALGVVQSLSTNPPSSDSQRKLDRNLNSRRVGSSAIQQLEIANHQSRENPVSTPESTKHSQDIAHHHPATQRRIHQTTNK